ncbi:MAG: OmpH family outer membrane protein [Qingshengfaniella sp.]
MIWRVVCVCLVLWPLGAMAQEETAPAAPAAPFQILTLDQDLLFLRSDFGQRLQRDLEQARDELAGENRRIEADLVAEERDLTAQRDQMTAAAFAPLAAAFDDRVQRIRREQETKSDDLQRQLDDARKAFVGAIGPVLADLARRHRASVIIDRTAILLALEGVDVTAEAVALINERLGDGTAETGQDSAPQ